MRNTFRQPATCEQCKHRDEGNDDPSNAYITKCYALPPIPVSRSGFTIEFFRSEVRKTDKACSLFKRKLS